jgi:hypothetical protein
LSSRGSRTDGSRRPASCREPRGVSQEAVSGNEPLRKR